MLHLLFDGRPWFRPKRRGYGSGLPIRWQGGAMLALHIALIGGIAMLFRDPPTLATMMLLVGGLAPLPLYRAKTEGGWRWR